MLSALKKRYLLYRKNKLVDRLAALSDEDAREVVRFSKKGRYLAHRVKKEKEEGHGQADIS